MAIEVDLAGKHAECVSCLTKWSDTTPIFNVRAGYKYPTGSVTWTVFRLCPKCRLDLLRKLYDPEAMPGDAEIQAVIDKADAEYSAILAKAAGLGEVLHDVIEQLRNALGGVVAALHNNGPIDVSRLESVLDVTRRRLTGNITDCPG